MSEHYGDKTGTYASMTAPTPEGRPTMTVEQAIACMDYAASKAREDGWEQDAAQFAAVASLLREMQGKIEALTAERDDWNAKCIALFWEGRADNITAGTIREAAAAIRQHLGGEK
jgi:hypothetical protein